MSGSDAIHGPAPALILSRRAVLRKSGLLAGGIGAAAFLAGCAQASAPTWTFAPAAPVTPTATPVPRPTVAGSSMPSGAPATASATAGMTASPQDSPSVSETPHDPSPADFAVPVPYRPALSTPVEFSLTSRDGPGQTIDISPGDGALVELTFAEPGTYPFVTHKFNDASKGAMGLFNVS